MLKNVINKLFEDKETTSSNKYNFKSLIGNKRNILVYIIAILVSRVGLIAGVNPFGIAILGAMAGGGIPLLLPLIIIAITTTISFGFTALLKFIISTICFALLKSFLKIGENKTGNAIKILLSCAIARSPS